MFINKNSSYKNKLTTHLKHSGGFLLCFLFKCNAVFTQVNLVVDPSMENYFKCPIATTANQGCYTWHSLDSMNNTVNAVKDCSPVYLNTCSLFPDNSCPQNYAQGYSYMYPRTGNGMYISVFYCDPVTCNANYNRDYLRGRLRTNLINGQEYCGKYYVSLYKSMMYGVDRLGAYLDNGALDINYECLPIAATPNFENPAFNYITDTTGWTKIQGSFTANGTETYITIGNFYSNPNTHRVLFNAASMWQESYYYVDDVSIIPIKITAFAGNDATICLSDSIVLGRPQEIGLECLWFKKDSLTAFSNNSSYTFKPKKTGTYSFVQQMDNCKLTYDTVTVTVVEDCNVITTLNIPNVFTPNEDNSNDTWHFDLKNASNVTFSIYNRWGLLMKNSDINTHNHIEWDGRTTSGEACSAGVYFYVVNYTDNKGEAQKKNGFISLFR